MKFEFINDSLNQTKYFGFNSEINKLLFVFPPFYNNESDDIRITRQEARYFAEALVKVKTEETYFGKKTERSPFYSMLWLIKDYIKNGFYFEKEKKVHKKNNGTIYWKKTIKTNDILVIKNGFIFKTIFRKGSNFNDASFLAEIYKAALSYSIEKLGFVFGLTNSFKTKLKIKDNHENSQLIYFLKSQLMQTNNDSKKILMKHLLTIISSAVDNETFTDFFVNGNEFEYVFERMVNAVLGNQKVSDFYNQFVYVFDFNKLPSFIKHKKEISASKLRPDTILKDDKNSIFYIIDSKFYKYGYTFLTSDLPQSSSIEKQIGYNEYLRKELLEKNNQLGLGESMGVKSIFALPTSANIKGMGIVNNIGYALRKNENKFDGNKIDNKIRVVLLDLKSLIHAYVNVDAKFNQNIFLESL